jgi:hypothetical protein
MMTMIMIDIANSDERGARRLVLQKKKSERGALFRVIDRVYSNVIGQAILRLLPPRPGVPGHHRLRI